MRFDPAKVLVDPYGRGAVVPKNYSRDAARNKGYNAAAAIKSVVTVCVLTILPRGRASDCGGSAGHATADVWLRLFLTIKSFATVTTWSGSKPNFL